MRADTGPIGGDLSHEFIILAETGESAVFCDRRWLETDILGTDVDYEGDLEPFFAKWTSLYAATDEKHDPKSCPVPESELVAARGIEVGHIFYFGTKYSKPMNAVVQGPNGETVPVEMGSYGIGVSRLVGAIIEASHDEKGIIWPESVAPFKVGLINLRPGDEACRAAAEEFGCTVEIKHLWSIPPIPFDERLIGFAKEALGGDTAIPSGPLHDAAEMARLIPTVMLFSSSSPPVSHTREEDTPEEDLRVMIDAYGRTVEATLAAAAAGDLPPRA
jgi:hypothetical protein